MRICFPPCKSRRFSARRARFGRSEKLYCARVIRRARFGGRAEICVEHQAGNRRVVGHIVVGIVRDDEIGVRIPDHVDNLVARRLVVVVDVDIVEHSADHFDARHLARTLRFRRTDLGQLVGRNDHMPQIARAQMTYDDSVAAFDTFCQRSRTGDLHVVRMRTDCQYVHKITSFFIPHYCNTNGFSLQRVAVSKKSKIIYLIFSDGYDILFL